MNLNPMMSDELINNSKTNPESSMTMETLLENCILFIVSAFCMGTEFRLLYQQQNQVNKLLLEQAERWHAKAVYYSQCFIPEQCPLIHFVFLSYIQNFCSEPKETPPKLQVNFQKTKNQILKVITKKTLEEKPPRPLLQ